MNPKWPIKQAGEQPSELESVLKGIFHHQAERAQDIIDLSHNVAALRAEVQNLFYGNQEELVTIYTSQDTTFNSNGYRLNSLYVSAAAVSDAAKITINYYGASWTITLQAGENELDIPNGATITGSTTSGFSFTGMLTRYNFRR